MTCADISQRWLTTCRKTLRRDNNVTFLQYKSDTNALGEDSFDVVYCHYVLHDIQENELVRVIPTLAMCLKPGGLLAFREPFSEAKPLSRIKRLVEQNGPLKESRITDVPNMGNTLESIYIRI